MSVITAWDCTHLIKLYTELCDYSGNSILALNWLTLPNEELSGRRPCECISSPVGYQRVLGAFQKLRDA